MRQVCARLLVSKPLPNTLIAALLNAFAEHESWETLSPAVFGVPAHQLEEEWHAYLRQAYPQPGNEPTILHAAAEHP